MDQPGNGLVEIYDEDPREPAIKIFRHRTSMREDETPIPDVELPITLFTPSGKSYKLGGNDIVQVFPRDRHGLIRLHKSEVFQGLNRELKDKNAGLPKGFSATDSLEALDGISLRDQVAFTHMDNDLQTPVENFTMQEAPAIEAPFLRQRKTSTDPKLTKLSNAISRLTPWGHTPKVTEICSPDAHDVSWVHYPMRWGRKVNLVLPTGTLVQGWAGDVIEEVITQGDVRTVIHKTSLENIAQDHEKGYFELR